MGGCRSQHTGSGQFRSMILLQIRSPSLTTSLFLGAPWVGYREMFPSLIEMMTFDGRRKRLIYGRNLESLGN
ncbi:hypothetical protein ACFL0Q_04330 [Thermodesulfobacteriota bacterium]